MNPSATRAYAVLAAGAVLWSLLILLPPILISLGAPEAGILLGRLFAPICHQEDGRSFHLLGHALGVCNRCAGVYFAFAAALLCFRFGNIPSRLRGMRVSRLSLFLLPMAADVAFDLIGWWGNSPLSRGVTGAVAGIGLAMFVAPAWIAAAEEFFPNHVSITMPRKVNDG